MKALDDEIHALAATHGAHTGQAPLPVCLHGKLGPVYSSAGVLDVVSVKTGISAGGPPPAAAETASVSIRLGS